MRRLTKILLVASVLGGPVVALAKPVTYTLPESAPIDGALKPEPDEELVQANCAACHSLDYISTQPPRKGQLFWTATVNKMIKTYGAPIEHADAEAIAAYLARNY